MRSRRYSQLSTIAEDFAAERTDAVPRAVDLLRVLRRSNPLSFLDKLESETCNTHQLVGRCQPDGKLVLAFTRVSNLTTVDPRLSIHPSDSLRVQKLVQSLVSVEPPKPTRLDTAVRKRILIVYRHRVDVHGTGLNLSRHPQSRLKVRREHRCVEPILGVVSKLQRLGLGVESEKRDAGSEGLGLVDVHGLVDSGNDGRQHSLWDLAYRFCGALLQTRSLFDSVGDQGPVLVRRHCVDNERPHVRLAMDLRLYSRRERLSEQQRHGIVHQNALGRHADLPRLRVESQRT